MKEEDYEAYVYCWTHKITDKKYIGYHKGSIHDSYDTSATCQEMIDAFGEGNLEIEIVAKGTVEDMIALERKMLLAEDARNNDEYYNKSNGGGAALKNFIKPSLDTLQESIDGMVTTPPSAILRQGSDTSSNDPRLNIPRTPENLI